MQSYTLNKNSWHFYLASDWGQHIYLDESMDICTYIRRVIIGAIKLTMASVIMSVVVGLLVAMELAFLYCACQFLFGDLSSVTNQHIQGLACVGTVANAFLALACLINWYKEKDIKVPTPGFVTLATKKFKSKTCFMVEFKE